MNLIFRFKRLWIKLFAFWGITGLVIILTFFSLPVGQAYAQQPTGSIPTVTGTPAGPYVTVYANYDQVGVYSGPSSYNYAQIGILSAEEKAPALGYSVDKTWIEVVYVGVPGGKGWVYTLWVSLSPGPLPVIASPPTATPRTTPTLDPTYVAAYGLQIEPTHLPTFTAPPPLNISTFAPDTGTRSKVPFGFIVLGLALIGILGAVISFLRGNR
ncbi:MAG: hypothetical protein ABIF04_06725 [Chloroflexota bacterium]